jgi:hypothetical protein
MWTLPEGANAPSGGIGGGSVKRTWTWTGVALGAVGLVVAGLFWLNFAPTRLGGDSI